MDLRDTELHNSFLPERLLVTAYLDELLTALGVSSVETDSRVSIFDTGAFRQASAYARLSDRNVHDKLATTLEETIRGNRTNSIHISRLEDFTQDRPYQLEIASISHTVPGAMTFLTGVLRRAHGNLEASQARISG